MGYYKDYIRETAAKTFDKEKVEFSLFDSDNNEMPGALEDELNEAVFIGAMREMVAYLYEQRNDQDGGEKMELLFDSENVEQIYISSRPLEAPTVIVEYETVPEWFSWDNADLREFYFHPKPGRSGEWTAAYFQPR